jgi:polyphosphate kinase
VYSFERDGEASVYIASADLMPRNLDHRVELAVPVEAEGLQAELLDTLDRCFADNQSSWDLDEDGAWSRRAPGPGEEPRSVQQELAELYAARAATERPSGEHDGAPLGAHVEGAQPVAAAPSPSSAALSSSTDW